MMVATLLEPGVDELRSAIRALDPIADAFEIRFDALRSTVKPAEIRKLTKKALVGTVRRTSDGGHYAADEHPRLELLEACLDAGFEHVDVEGPTTVPGPEDRLIRSRHDFQQAQSAATLARWGRELGRNGALAKVAARVDTFEDRLAILEATRTLATERVQNALMGLGEFPRALLPLVGASLVYGGGRTTAPGQPTLESIQATLDHWGRPGPSPNLYLVVGSPIAHSRSPRMHNAAIRTNGIDASYGALEIANESELVTLLSRAKALGLRGMSVTTPLKDAAHAAVQHRTREAETAAAVNCIKIDASGATGHDTDGLGARVVLRRLAPSKDSAVLVAGTGGVARAILAANPDRSFTFAGRSAAGLAALAERGGATITLKDARSALSEYDVLINATRVEDPLPIDGYRGALFDLHYGDGPSAWDRHAQKHGLVHATGRELLVEQGVLSFEFWFGQKPPRDAMAAAVGAVT